MAASDRNTLPTSDRQAGAAWLRDNLPTVAAVAADFREAFGDVRLAWAKEGGHEVGKKS